MHTGNRLGVSIHHVLSLSYTLHNQSSTMSDLFRQSMLTRLPQLPPTRAPWAEEDEDGMEEMQGEEAEGNDSISDLRAS
jgi:hypothetical protein